LPFRKTSLLAAAFILSEHRAPMKLLLLLLLAMLFAGTTPTRADATTPPASAAATAPSAPVDPAKEAEIRKMIQTTGVEKTMKLVMDRMFDSFKQQNSSLPGDFWARIETEMNANTSDLIEQLIPVYAQYYSMDDLKAVNAFYESPAGQHMIQAQPQIASAAMQIGQQWGQGMAAKVMAEIQAEQAKTPASSTPASLAPASGK
jgi:hypothetical protein